MLEQTPLFQDEKGPIAAKTYGGASWCSTQGKAEHSQKTKRIMNIFGAYDYANDKCLITARKRRTANSFLNYQRSIFIL